MFVWWFVHIFYCNFVHLFYMVGMKLVSHIDIQRHIRVGAANGIILRSIEIKRLFERVHMCQRDIFIVRQLLQTLKSKGC